ncbi:MAG: hypothetical protein AAF467_27350 [Actinomycetota bacterium]
MAMADCRLCSTRITSLRDAWVHLDDHDQGDHDPEPPLSHAWHRRRTDSSTFHGYVPPEPTSAQADLFNNTNDNGDLGDPMAAA